MNKLDREERDSKIRTIGTLATVTMGLLGALGTVLQGYAAKKRLNEYEDHPTRKWLNRKGYEDAQEEYNKYSRFNQSK